MLHLIYPVIAVSIGLNTLFSQRDVTRAGYESSTIWAGTSSPLRSHMLQGITAVVLVICLAYVWKRAIRKDFMGWDCIALLKAFTLFFVSTVILNGAFGSSPSFNYHSVYCLIIATAVLLESPYSIDKAIHAAKIGLLVLVAASGLAAIYLPSMSLQQNYVGILPLVEFRLWGLSSHPNSLGAVSLLLLLLLLYRPLCIRWRQYAAILVTLCVFLLAQSKTTCISAVVSLGVMFYYSFNARFGRKGGMLITSICAFMLFGLILGAFVIDETGQVAKFASSKQGVDTITLSGRDQIWSVAISEWTNNPLFGYGPSLWDEEFRQKIEMDFAFSAHNQFLQSLASAGLFGFCSLVVYLLVLARYAFRTARQTQGLTLAMLAVLIIRCITETPLDLVTFLNGDFLMHMLLLQVLIASTPYTLKSSLLSNSASRRDLDFA